jgi:hypothetical protein
MTAEAIAVTDDLPVEQRRTPYTVGDLADHNAYRESLKASRLEASGMSRIAPPSEKIDATVKIIKELINGLGLDPDPVFVAQSAVPINEEEWRKATEPLRLVPNGQPEITWRIPPVVMAAVIEAGSRIAMATDTRDMGILGGPLPAAEPFIPIHDPFDPGHGPA